MIMAQESKASETVKEYAIIVGVGPSLGRSFALKFASNGYNIVLVSRSKTSTDPIKEEVNKAHKSVCVECISVDTTDEAKVKSEYEKLLNEKGQELGECGVLIYNAGPKFNPKSILDTSVDEFLTGYKAGCVGALIWSQQVLPKMLANKKGSILLTGATASLRGGATFQTLACPKFGLRALSQSLAREFQKQHIHVAHFIIDGVIYSEKTSKWLPV